MHRYKYKRRDPLFDGERFMGGQDQARALVAWIVREGGNAMTVFNRQMGGTVVNLDGTAVAPGSWIVRHGRGQFSAMSDEVFRTTYERAYE